MEAKFFDLLEKLYVKVDTMEKNMATKDELDGIRKSMATKDELDEIRKSMATKDELDEIRKSMATKDELDEIRKSMATKDELDEIRKSMATKNDLDSIRQTLVRLENKMDLNHKTLYDGYQLTYEKLNILEDKFDELNAKVEKQEVEIRVIKGAQ